MLERDVDHAVDEHQHHEAQRLVHPVGIDQQRDRHRQRAERELTDGDERPSGVAAGNRGGVAGRRGGDGHLQRRVRWSA